MNRFTYHDNLVAAVIVIISIAAILSHLSRKSESTAIVKHSAVVTVPK